MQQEEEQEEDIQGLLLDVCVPSPACTSPLMQHAVTLNSTAEHCTAVHCTSCHCTALSAVSSCIAGLQTKTTETLQQRGENAGLLLQSDCNHFPIRQSLATWLREGFVWKSQANLGFAHHATALLKQCLTRKPLRILPHP